MSRWTLVDATPAREHVKRLRKTMSTRAIAAAAWLSKDTVQGVEFGHKTHITPETAEAILSVTAPPAGSRFKVPAGPTLDLIDALVATGMSKAQVARAIGLKPTCMPARMSHGKPQRTVRYAVAHAIHELALERGVTTRQRKPAEACYALSGEAVDRLLDVHGWDIEALLEQARVPREVYMHYRRQARHVSEDTAERMAIAFGVRVETLFEAVA